MSNLHTCIYAVLRNLASGPGNFGISLLCVAPHKFVVVFLLLKAVCCKCFTCCIKLAYFVDHYHHHHNFSGLSVFVLQGDGYCHALIVNLIVFHSHTHDIVSVARLQTFCFSCKIQGTVNIL